MWLETLVNWWAGSCRHQIIERTNAKMKNIAQLHRASLDATRVTVAGVKADQWTWPTPNEGWDVRALLNHS